MGVDIPCCEIVLFTHVLYDLVQGFFLGNEKIADFAFMFGPIQGWLVILGHLINPTVGWVNQ